MYIALDIETTGLDPSTCQVLEIAMIADVQTLAVCDCPVFHAIIEPEGPIVGEPCALAMNAVLLRKIGEGVSERLSVILRRLDIWLDHNTTSGLSTLLGKNVGSFDWQFVKRLEGFPRYRFSHRFLDVGSMYAKSSGVQSQAELAKQVVNTCSIPGKEHEAVYDARVSLALARAGWGIEV
jgi:oligoribonuclease (3'-5' exoribonuclease)